MEDTKRLTGTEVDIDKALLHKILNNHDFTRMNMMEVVNIIYESTYMAWYLKWYDEMMRREKYENTIIDKVGVISQLEEEIKAYKEKFGTLGDSSTEEDTQEATGGTQLEMFCEGSDGDQRHL